MEFLIGAKVRITHRAYAGSKGVIINVSEGYNYEDGSYNLFFVQIGKIIVQFRTNDFVAA